MRSPQVFILLATLLGALALPVESGATSCHPKEYENHLLYADWVFLGTVVDARFSSVERRAIDFTMAEIDRIRGEPPDRVDLETSMGAYDPRITIGERYLVFVNSTNRYVGLCSRFKVYGPEEYLEVLLLRPAGDCGTAAEREIAVMFARQEFFRGNSPASMEMVDEMLRRAQLLSPTLRIKKEQNSVTAKGIRFRFTEGSLSAIESVECVTP